MDAIITSSREVVGDILEFLVGDTDCFGRIILDAPPSHWDGASEGMSYPYHIQVKIYAFSKAPRGMIPLLGYNKASKSYN